MRWFVIRAEIKSRHCLEVTDDCTGETYLGCSQEWYASRWRRLSGCGPSVFSNIVCYLDRRGCDSSEKLYRKDVTALMDDIWRFVTPTVNGISTTNALTGGVAAYEQFYSRGITVSEFPVGKRKEARPGFAKLLGFLLDMLAGDMPVAFLCLDNGAEKQLDTWHWTTLLSLEYPEDMSAANAELADNCRLLEFDLYNWYSTTAKGGGFVGFRVL